jgi:hypothetical protein
VASANMVLFWVFWGFFCLFVCLFGVVLGIEPRALAMSAKGITA